MRVFWEQTGVLLPIYRLAAQGLSDCDIANKLSITELKVQNCMAWLLHFLKMSDRNQLISYASPAGTTCVILTK
jgi:DNA-binding NarL/FixJ family response regulator